MKCDISVTQYVDGIPIVIPGRPLEPPLKPSDWYEPEPEDEEYDDGIDLEQGYVFRFGGRRNIT